jgi:hypothetical protein
VARFLVPAAVRVAVNISRVELRHESDRDEQGAAEQMHVPG